MSKNILKCFVMQKSGIGRTVARFILAQSRPGGSSRAMNRAVWAAASWTTSYD